MFTIIDNEIYQVNGDKMRKVIVEDGTLRVNGDVENYDKTSILITANELRRQYAELFKTKESNYNVSDEELVKELDEKNKKIKSLEDELKSKNNEITQMSKELDEALQVLEQLKTNNKEETNSNKEEQENPKDKEQK